MLTVTQALRGDPDAVGDLIVAQQLAAMDGGLPFGNVLAAGMLLPAPRIRGWRPLTDRPAPRTFYIDPDGVASRELGIQFPEWQPGNPITQLTQTGAYPRWFSQLASEKPTQLLGDIG